MSDEPYESAEKDVDRRINYALACGLHREFLQPRDPVIVMRANMYCVVAVPNKNHLQVFTLQHIFDRFDL